MAAVEDRALDWNEGPIENPQEGGGDFVLIPEGVYPFRVTKFERGRHDGSEKLGPCPKAVVTILVGDSKVGMTTRAENLFLHTRTEGILCSFFTAIGHRKSGEPLVMNWNKVLNAEGYCRIKHHEYKAKDGQKRVGFGVSTWLAPEEGAAKYEAQCVNPPVAAAPQAEAPEEPKQDGFNWETGQDDDLAF